MVCAVLNGDKRFPGVTKAYLEQTLAEDPPPWPECPGLEVLMGDEADRIYSEIENDPENVGRVSASREEDVEALAERILNPVDVTPISDHEVTLLAREVARLSGERERLREAAEYVRDARELEDDAHDVEAAVALAREWIALLEDGNPKQGCSGEDVNYLARWLVYLHAEVARLSGELTKERLLHPRSDGEWAALMLALEAAEEERGELREAYDAEKVRWHQELDRRLAAEGERERLREIAQRFVDKYEGNKAGVLGNGAARRALDEFRAALSAGAEQ